MDEVRLEVEFWNTGNWEIFEQIYAPDYVGHDPAGLHGTHLEELKQAATMLLGAFTDVRLVADDLIAEGNKVVKRWTVRCKHTGELMGIPASGKEMMWTGTNVFRIVDGKIEECWVESDALGMMRQLGAIPTG